MAVQPAKVTITKTSAFILESQGLGSFFWLGVNEILHGRLVLLMISPHLSPAPNWEERLRGRAATG